MNKKIVFIIVIIVIILGINLFKKSNKEIDSTNSIITSDEKMKFDKDDVILEGLRFGMTPDEVKSDFGEPEQINHEINSEFIYGEYISYIYEDMNLMFFDKENKGNLTLGSIQITGTNLKLINGLSIGSSKEDVINSYYNDNQGRKVKDDFKDNTDWALLLYGDYLYTSSQSYKLPEKYEQTAFVHLYSNYISYECYIPNEESFEKTSLIFRLGEDNKVTGIEWNSY